MTMFHTKLEHLSPQIERRKQAVTWIRPYCLILLISFICFISLLQSDLLGWNTLELFRCSLLKISDNSTRGKPFKWNEIDPSLELQWNNCYEQFQCAKLDLPLDWLDPSEQTRVAIAVIRLEATEKDDYKGPVFVNPGGPGGSGVSMLKEYGKALQTIIGKNHDVISFDPRGVGISTPRINCYPSLRTIQIWNLLNTGLLDSHPGVLYDAFARASAYSASCNEVIGGINISELDFESPYVSNKSRNIMEAGPGRFVSTTSVARDMLEIVNKGGWEKLKYWGFSYGTVLGGTFAAMFPDKIDRMVNDGNVNLIQWTTNRHTSFLKDSDAVMEAFHTYCHSYGPLICSFYASSPQLIELRLDTLLNSLKIHPVIVPAPLTTEGFPQIVSYTSVKRLISTALYRPIQFFPMLAEILAALEIGNGLPFLKFTEANSLRTPFIPDASCTDGNDLLDIDDSEDAFKAVMCSDGDEMIDTVEEFKEYARGLMEVSKSNGAVGSQDFRLSCAGWKIKAKWRFVGPFTGNTSYPILFIANSADNVTPLQSALNNSAGFPESVVLIQESFGHTSLAAPSTCKASHVRAYFQHGMLPPAGTRCKSDLEPFEISSNRQAKDQSLMEDIFDKETREVEDALLHLTRSPNFAVRGY